MVADGLILCRAICGFPQFGSVWAVAGIPHPKVAEGGRDRNPGETVTPGRFLSLHLLGLRRPRRCKGVL